jgi:hypothetical protein
MEEGKDKTASYIRSYPFPTTTTTTYIPFYSQKRGFQVRDLDISWPGIRSWSIQAINMVGHTTSSAADFDY